MSRLLIIKPSSLGDVIHGLLVAQVIRQQNPETHITWVAAGAYAPLVSASTVVDKVLIFERHAGLGAFRKLVAEIRRTHFDYVLDFQGLARSAAMTFLSRAKHKFGRSDSREGSRFFYDKKAPLPAMAHPHAVDILLAFLPLMGLKKNAVSPLVFRLPQPPFRLPQDFGRSLLVFPESRRPEKCWPHFAALVSQIAAAQPKRSILWCGSADIKSSAPKAQNVINLAGQTQMTDIVWLIAHGGCVLANDSGPMHIAAASGKPVCALFGPTAPESYGPYPLSHPNHLVLHAAGGEMKNLSVELVREALLTKLLTQLPL